ncbi:MAG: response regulator [Deltaproteobacteria bacterium]|nr:response regulator [Deltaproteobacteria bacterium]
MNDSGQDQWQVFISEAMEHLHHLSDRCSEKPDQPATTELERQEAQRVRDEIALIELAAWMAGSDGLATALRRLRGLLGDHPARKRLLETINKLAAALAQLNDPATTDEALVAQLLDETLAAWQGPSADEPNRDGLSSDDFVWSPTVDEQMLSAFVDECTERIENLSGKLLTLEQNDDSAPLLDEIFRDLHTLKGSAAFVSLVPLNDLAHAAEDLVGELKSGKKMVDSNVVDALLNAKDAMSAVLDLALRGGVVPGKTVKQAMFILHHPLDGVGTPPPVDQDENAIPAQRSTPAVAHPSHRAIGAASNTIRVGFEKLDVLLNLVGELVVSKGNLHVLQQSSESLSESMADLARSARQAVGRKTGARRNDLGEETDRMSRFAREVSRSLDDHLGRLDFTAARLRDQVMSLRMVPVARIFTKQERTVRDLSRSLGKSVRLVLEGQNTELDKLMVEQLDEPLLHLVRNAIDHGIEEPAARRAVNKPEQGTLTLSAEHRGAQLLVRVQDDGRGIEPETVRARAIERSLIDEEQAGRMDRRQILQFLFQPGFSTAKIVTNISGRGVGLDVVASVLDRLRGSVSVDSHPGKGTVFTLTIPLTLAIRQVLLVRVAGRLCALPLDWVKRTMTIDPDAIDILAGRPVYGTDPPVGVVQLGTILGLPSRSEPNNHLILVEQQETLFALACQELVGRQEVLVKTMGSLLVAPPFISGATILDGRVVPILDLAALIQTHLDGRTNPHGPAPTSPTRRTKNATMAAGTVLLVDDSPPARTLLGRMYQDLGFEIVEAADGDEAADLAQNQAFDLVSTDVRMPVMDGYELARTLRSNPNTRRIPIVMISAKEDRIDVIRGFDSGVDAYLSKPVDKEELARIVTRIVRGDKR